MRLMVCAGGTGGGVYPALAVLQALGEDPESILWVGAEGGMEKELVTRAGIPFTTVPAGAVHGVGLSALVGLGKLLRGYFASKKVIRGFKPDLLLFTGGFVSIPVGLAGRKLPTLVCLPDIEPGLALRVVARFADQIAVPSQDSRKYFAGSKKVTVTGYPTRSDLNTWTREEAFEAFDLSPDQPTLLVFGGSQGARSINQALVKELPRLLSEMQIVHITGEQTWAEVESAARSLSPELAKKYRPYPYLHAKMGAAFRAADLAICRAGASVLGELPLFKLPAVLVPYPYAWRYQKVNAAHLAVSGGAVIINDEELSEKLSATVLDLMHNKSKLEQMRAAMQSRAIPQAANAIAELIRHMVPAKALTSSRGSV